VTTAEKIQTAGVLIAALAIAARFYETARTERRRTQPVVIVHERRGRLLDSSGFGSDRRAWLATVWLENEGPGPAFNVRFGVEYDGIKVAHKMHEEDPDRGNRQRVLGAGKRLPPGTKVIPLRIASEAIWGVAARRVGKGRKGDMDQGRVYWCRYENAIGQTWETRNPGDRSADLQIRRVRFTRLRERYEIWQYRRAIKSAEALERDTVKALREGMTSEPEERPADEAQAN
jgi:hypothetical protein